MLYYLLSSESTHNASSATLLEQNLDVNMAVNNLLNRDDDGDREHGDDSDSQGSLGAGLPPFLHENTFTLPCVLCFENCLLIPAHRFLFFLIFAEELISLLESAGAPSVSALETDPILAEELLSYHRLRRPGTQTVSSMIS